MPPWRIPHSHLDVNEGCDSFRDVTEWVTSSRNESHSSFTVHDSLRRMWMRDVIRDGMSHIHDGFVTERAPSLIHIRRNDSFRRMWMRDMTHSGTDPSRMWLIHVRDVAHLSLRHATHSFEWHDSFIRVLWLVHVRDGWERGAVTRSHAWRMWTGIYICIYIYIYIWLNHIRDEAHSFFFLIVMTWHILLIHRYDMTYSYVQRHSFICAVSLFHMHDMTHSYVWHDYNKRIAITQCCWREQCVSQNCRHDAFMCVTSPIRIPVIHCCWRERCVSQNCLFFVFDMTYSHVWHHSYVSLLHSAASESDVSLAKLPFLGVWHGAFICVTSLTRISITHCCSESIESQIYFFFPLVIWHIHLCGITYVRHPSSVSLLYNAAGESDETRQTAIFFFWHNVFTCVTSLIRIPIPQCCWRERCVSQNRRFGNNIPLWRWSICTHLCVCIYASLHIYVYKDICVRRLISERYGFRKNRHVSLSCTSRKVIYLRACLCIYRCVIHICIHACACAEIHMYI